MVKLDMNPLLKRAWRTLKIFSMFATMIASFITILWLLFQIKNQWAGLMIIVALMLAWCWWVAEEE